MCDGNNVLSYLTKCYNNTLKEGCYRVLDPDEVVAAIGESREVQTAAKFGGFPVAEGNN